MVKSKKWLSIGVAAFVAALMMGVAAPAYAEGGDTNTLKVSPSGTHLTLTPGRTLQGSGFYDCSSTLSESCAIKVENTGKNTFKYKVYVTPYVVTSANNDLSFSDSGNAHSQIARWIKVKNAAGEFVSEAVYEIAAGETQTIDYKVEVPEDIPGGSQYAVIWAQIINEQTGGIQTVGQVGSVITGRSSTNSVEDAEVTNIKMTRFSLGGTLTASAKIKDAGNTDFVANYRYVAKTFFGKEIYNEEQRLAAYPDMEYDIAVEWENPPMLGIFQVEFAIDAADEHISEKHIVVIMPVIVMILLILLLTVVVFWIIIIIRKRKERKARKLV